MDPFCSPSPCLCPHPPYRPAPAAPHLTHHCPAHATCPAVSHSFRGGDPVPPCHLLLAASSRRLPSMGSTWWRCSSGFPVVLQEVESRVTLHGWWVCAGCGAPRTVACQSAGASNGKCTTMRAICCLVISPSFPCKPDHHTNGPPHPPPPRSSRHHGPSLFPTFTSSPRHCAGHVLPDGTS